MPGKIMENRETHTPERREPESKKRPVVHSLAFSIFDTWVWKTGNTAICDYPGPLILDTVKNTKYSIPRTNAVMGDPFMCEFVILWQKWKSWLVKLDFVFIESIDTFLSSWHLDAVKRPE